MLWSGPRSSSPGAVALEQRGDIARPWGRGMGGRHRQPASSRRPNRYKAAFCNDGITMGGSLRETSHIGFWTRCLVRSHTSLVVSSRCLVLPASTPHTPSPPLQRCLFLTGSAAAGRCSNRKSSVLSLPSWKKIWVELRLVSHKPHGRYWGPCVCTADHGPGACAQHLQHRLLQHTVTSPIGAEEAMQ
jgi:hypothetical protein